MAERDGMTKKALDTSTSSLYKNQFSLTFLFLASQPVKFGNYMAMSNFWRFLDLCMNYFSPCLQN